MKTNDPAVEKSRSPKGRDGDAPSGTRSINSIDDLRLAVNGCRRCPLWRAATQGVPGEGPSHASLMLVGEQPGDAEDQEGQPFVGPAGAILDRALREANIARPSVYVTNAVKHFKFEPRGKRRLHAKPNAGEIQACHWWLGQELNLVKPKLVIALGATAARSLLGRTITIASVRGSAVPLGESMHIWVTIHPSYLLRIQEEALRRSEYQRFVQELEGAKAWLLEWLRAHPVRSRGHA